MRPLSCVRVDSNHVGRVRAEVEGLWGVTAQSKAPPLVPPVSVSASTGLHKVHLAVRRAGASGRAGLGQSGSADERREKRRPRSPAGTCEGDTAAAAPGKGVSGPVLLTRGVSLNPSPRGWAERGPHAQNRAAHASRSPPGSRHASRRLHGALSNRPHYSVGVRQRRAFYLPSFRTRSRGLLAPLVSHPSALQARHAPTSTAALRVHPRLCRCPSPHLTLQITFPTAPCQLARPSEMD